MANNFYDEVYYGNALQDLENHNGHIPPDIKRENLFYKSMICPEPGKKLLDVGCGPGSYLSLVKDSGASLWGIDISHTATSIAKKKVPHPEQILCENADPLPFSDGEFDYVTAWGVIEHFPSLPSILKEIKRVAKQGAEIAIMVPNVYYYKFIWDTFRKGAGPVKHQEIEVLYSFQEWKDLIESVGLSVRKVHRHNKFNKPPFVIWMREYIIPFYLSNHFIFMCTK
ncbi:MAG: class I SAM-dependent methyltransferase [Candidatus Omnitrophica bacterium]|nr:class I SAM-dependent methyltransferase [Candidatus Omnitrophota bacterium]